MIQITVIVSVKLQSSCLDHITFISFSESKWNLTSNYHLNPTVDPCLGSSSRPSCVTSLKNRPPWALYAFCKSATRARQPMWTSSVEPLERTMWNTLVSMKRHVRTQPRKALWTQDIGKIRLEIPGNRLLAWTQNLKKTVFIYVYIWVSKKHGIQTPHTPQMEWSSSNHLSNSDTLSCLTCSWAAWNKNRMWCLRALSSSCPSHDKNGTPDQLTKEMNGDEVF